MNNKNWEAIWNSKYLEKKQNISLGDLINLNGFDGGAGKIDSKDWEIYIKKICELLILKNSESVFEVGCGCGALLYQMSLQKKIKVSGIDYSQSLIGVAKKIMPFADFEVANASDLSVDVKFDHVLSNSVFQYFSINDAEKILKLMIKKAKKNIFILDIPSLEKKELCLKVRKSSLGEKEYNQKYEGLDHTFYSHEWFKNICKDQEDINEVTFCNQIIFNYNQSEFRFNCFIKKSENK
jgi:ubiquinone/menaquinone biosynthesis C-methylase UbiE